MTQLRIKSLGNSLRCIILLFLFVLTMLVCGWCQAPPRTNNAASLGKPFNGKWWSATGADERSGFLNGAADCLTWKAHEKGFNAAPEQLMEKITNFYKAHPESADNSVIDVWRGIVEQASSEKKPEPKGETWKNPHWYLDGYWWREGTEMEQRGFLEGYLMCMRMCVSDTSETYSMSVNYYRDKIWEYLESHPKDVYKQAIADILSRFRDHSNS